MVGCGAGVGRDRNPEKIQLRPHPVKALLILGYVGGLVGGFFLNDFESSTHSDSDPLQTLTVLIFAISQHQETADAKMKWLQPSGE